MLPDGTLNAMRLQRLKDKLGNRSNASAEVEYEDAVAFEGVAQFPARVKCAMLGWSAVRDSLLRVQVATKEES